MPIRTLDFPAELYQDLVTQFLAELMVVTQGEPTPEAFQHATQAYCDALRPWLEPGDCPTPPRQVFSLLEDCPYDDDIDHIAVRLSPEGYAVFRAWLRRQSDLVRAGAYPHIRDGPTKEQTRFARASARVAGDHPLLRPH